jgi:hypothetical protein
MLGEPYAGFDWTPTAFLAADRGSARVTGLLIISHFITDAASTESMTWWTEDGSPMTAVPPSYLVEYA